ncbi:hypothetical protein LPJ61_001470, partial [Coemansia biformis]
MTSDGSASRPADGADSAGAAGEVSGYIKSLHLERANTKAGHQNIVQRRRTLMKQARNPQADQAALEQEIRQVERLASLLGRRQTRFDRKRDAPKVNHDLDVTLGGFFDVHEENDRLGDILLAEGRRAELAQDGGDTDEVADPELMAENIGAAPSALIAQHREAAGSYRGADDPFDRIEELNAADSPSRSAEYLPLDTYSADGAAAAAASEEKRPPMPSAPQGLYGGAVAGSRRLGSGTDAPELSDDGSDGEMLLGVRRSETWKRQSVALIKDREQYGPTFPAIPDDSTSDEGDGSSAADARDDGPSCGAEPSAPSGQTRAFARRKMSVARAKVVANALDSLAHAGRRATTAAAAVPDSSTGKAAPAAGAATLSSGHIVPGVLSPPAPQSALAVEAYLDIMDYVGTTGLPEGEFARCDPREDGHVSSDLDGNNATSSDSDIELSESDSGSSDSDYLSRIAPPRTYSIANVVDGSAAAPEAGAAGMLAPAPQQASLEPRGAGPGDESAVHTAPSGLGARSTLRRSRRVVGKGMPARSGWLRPLSSRLLAGRAAQSADSSARSSTADDEHLSAALTSSLALEPRAERAASDAGCPQSGTKAGPAERASVGADRTGAPAGGPPTTGLARLAEDAIAAAAQQQQAEARTRRTAPATGRTGYYKPLPIPPDRVARTMEAVDAKATTQAGSPPPLPNKDRPRIPHALAADGLHTRAELVAALDRPSSAQLFGSRQPEDR